MPQVAHSADAAASHPYAFAFMFLLMLIFAIQRVAKETKTSVKKWTSFLHFWMLAYFILLTALMSVTTAMALVLLVDEKGEPRVNFIPPSCIAISAALIGVFGFEFLLQKFIIGFGESKFDLTASLQNLVDQAVAATLKREAGG